MIEEDGEFKDDDKYDCKPMMVNHRQNGPLEKSMFGSLFGDRKKKLDKNDRRKIIQCIGKTAALINKRKGWAGTATIFKYDAGRKYAYAITCAHNVTRNPKENKGQKYYRKIVFQRRRTKGDTKLKCINNIFKKKWEEYEVINYYHLPWNYTNCDDNDLAILVIKDHDGFYKRLFQQLYPEKISLIPSNVLPQQHIINYEIYGFPHNEKEEKKDDIYGMCAPSYDTILHNVSEKDETVQDETTEYETLDLYFDKHENEDISLFEYNAIDTEPGQSGSAIFTSFSDGKTYGIVGVHTAGIEGEKNWGVALNKQRIEWINKCISLNHDIKDQGKNEKIHQPFPWKPNSYQ